MKIKPLGFYVLIEIVIVEHTSEGGIVLPDNLVSKEQEATDIGYVRAIGPTAYVGYPGCEVPDSVTGDSVEEILSNYRAPHDKWGVQIGDKIEYRRFEGKASAVKDYENYRYIPDSHIIGVIDDE